MESKELRIGEIFVSKRRVIFIILTAIVTITIVSKSSPIYPFNDAVDANAIMTVGKSILRGKVPYRDLFDHKGPFLYFLYMIASVISERTFVGLYFIEVIAAAWFLYLSYKIMNLYYLNVSILFIPVLSAVVYSATSFLHGGLVEEFCMPLFAYALYVGVNILRNEEYPGVGVSVIIGITSAFVFWMKFNLAFFYLGWILIPAIILIKKGKIKSLLKMLLLILGGVLLATLPIISYFAINGAVGDLFEVYFYDNLFLYSSTVDENIFIAFIKNIAAGFSKIFFWNFVNFFALVVGLIALFIKLKKECVYVICSFLAMLISIYAGLYGGYDYYSFPIGVFSPFIFAVGYEFSMTEKDHRLAIKIEKYGTAIVCIISICYVFLMSSNTYLLKYKKSDMPQFQFAEIISKKENATVLNYDCMDMGLYTTCGIVPNCKYFYKSNLEVPEMMETQEEFVEDCKVDFIVTKDELENQNYKCIASTGIQKDDVIDDIYGTYYLYELQLNK